jgi:hypothetical protein
MTGIARPHLVLKTTRMTAQARKVFRMELPLPRPIETYIRAENSGDVDAVANCFAPYATVRDEGHLYEGVPAIKNWKASTKKRYDQTVTPLEISTSNGNATLKAKLAGTFPGSPVIASFHFALVNDQIASLRIHNQPQPELNA